jgi:uncharacterized cupin superfamily protein
MSIVALKFCVAIFGLILTTLASNIVAYAPISTNANLISRVGRTLSPTSFLKMSTETTVGPEIEVVTQPDREYLEKKGVFNWGTWGCEASKFPWTYDSSERCYLLKGKVTVTPTDGRKAVTFGAGDFVTFPAGMSCTWDVSEAVHKHFMFF